MPKYSDVEKLDKINTPQDIAANPKFGIYAYITDKDEIIYIGKDRGIDTHKRYRDHIAPSCYDDQAINKYIQTPGVAKRVRYMVLAICADEVEMNNLETIYILFYKALGQCRFNHAIDINGKLIDTLKERLGENLKIN
ncbi:hypothetical protein [Herbiconiux daphne]|uniref:GIY-YIG domain-containing protein n=1 Tax=Herbiconiux daphne TaxID=2970914 RepID=A0ABT2HAL3_9MICO|nr:hypothetical protein [Herbiconiux daphne]MCS5736929.1 hypothetical protein [Herbiconiux daphne]